MGSGSPRTVQVINPASDRTANQRRSKEWFKCFNRESIIPAKLGIHQLTQVSYWKL